MLNLSAALVVKNMTEEHKYRTETEENESKEKRGFLRPLPGEERPVEQQGVPMVKFLGFTISEKQRDMLVALLMPTLVAIIDTAIFTLNFMQMIPNDALYIVGLPLLAAIPIGMTVQQINMSIVGVILCSIECFVMLTLFLLAPSFIIPTISFAETFLIAIPTAFVCLVFVAVSSFIGVFMGIILQEFF